MNFQDEPDRERRRKLDDESSAAGEPRKPRKSKGQPAEVGDALRSIYNDAIHEDIPPEMLDLLGKLN